MPLRRGGRRRFDDHTVVVLLRVAEVDRVVRVRAALGGRNQPAAVGREPGDLSRLGAEQAQHELVDVQRGDQELNGADGAERACRAAVARRIRLEVEAFGMEACVTAARNLQALQRVAVVQREVVV